MGYEYPNYGQAAAFVPASMAFPKKKAKALKVMVDVPLSLAQQAIAKALGWADWFSLEQAVKAGRKPSAPDEAVDKEEQLRRWSTQFFAIQDTLNLRLPDPEWIVAELGLTCSGATARQCAADIGPWGAFQEPPTEIAPGIWLGECAKFHCYRLSPERLAAVPAAWQFDTAGWFMCDDHGWRVELAFPEVFDQATLANAKRQFAEDQPLLYELAYGAPPKDWRKRVPDLARRAIAARQQPGAWFALSAFPDWSLSGGGAPLGKVVVSAIRGRDLLRLIDDNGVWPTKASVDVVWFATTIWDLRKRVAPDLSGRGLSTATTCLTGILAYAHAPVCAQPFKRHPFDVDELISNPCLSYQPLVSEIADGVPVPLR